MRSTTYLTAAAACTAAVLAVTGLSPATAAPAAAPAPAKHVPKESADFNGDGYADLAVGAPDATVSGLKRAGLVSIVYGSPTGLRYDKQQVINRATPGIPGEPAATAYGSGHESAYGDLNADGYDDLAINAFGRILVLWGGASGISGGTDLPVGTGTPESPRTETGSPSIGDVSGDGKDDLVLPGQTGMSTWGLATWLGPFDRATGKPASTQFRDTSAKDGMTTHSVRVGDMSGDGVADIVVMGSDNHGGLDFKAILLKSTRTGPVQGGTLDSLGLVGAFGDINGDGYGDFVGKRQGYDRFWTGGITVTYGDPYGASNTLPARFYDQDTAGVPGVNEKGDLWGNDFTLGDIDKDGYADLVIGAARESGTGATTEGAGAVTVLRGSKTGLTGAGSQVFTQNSAGIPSTSEKSDHFGTAVALLDANKDGKPELYVGGNGEDNWVGRVWQLQNSGTGLTGTGATSFSLGGGYGSAHFGEWFGQ